MGGMRRQGKYTRRVTPAQHVKRKVKHRFRWWRKLSWKKRILFIGGPLLAVLVLIPLLTYLYFARDISDMDRLMNRNNTGIVLYASDGKTEVYSTGRAEHRDLVPLDKISTPVKEALIASEDKDFYEHGGFSILSTLRAVYGYVLNGGGSFGGSTITQQLAKITVLSSDRSFLRQYQAFSIAVAIENTYSKDEILQMYLNSVYFGENAFGIEQAAKVYFGTTPDKLNLAQAAMLIGVLPAPSIYSPVTGNAEYAKERQTTVLSRMVDNGYITEQEKEKALATKLKYEPARSPINDSIAPHFAEMVLGELYEKYGEETVTRSGYRVTTTLDAKVQKALQDGITANMPTIKANGGSNSAAVAIDPKTGEIRGLVGSYDWNDDKFGKVNVATALRQPGSSFKPIYYSHALANGIITPATVLHDKRTDFGGGYVPMNADRQFRGNVTVRNSLAWSLNIPSVEVMQKFGIEDSVDAAQRMGLESINGDHNYGLSLALGAAEVRLLDLTNAYAAFANKGKQYEPTMIKSINSKYGDRVFEAEEPKSEQVISEQGAFLISDILSDNAARAAVFGSSLNVYDAKTGAVKKVAVKTGTTNDSRDAWTMGYTPQLAVGVWVGNNDNTAMLNGGSIMAGPIFTKSMGTILAGVDTKFEKVSGIVQRHVCRSNYGLAEKAVEGKTFAEYFLSTALPTTKCSVSSPKPTPSKSVSPEPGDTITITLSADPANSNQYNGHVTFTATLSKSDATGTVTFYDNGGDSLGSSPVLPNGTASVVVSNLSNGPHAITAVFEPDNDLYEPTTSSPLTYNITGEGNGGGNGNGNESGRPWWLD